MAKIEIYVRIRPTGRRFSALTSSQSSQTVQVGNTRETGQAEKLARLQRHDFKFSHIFEENSTQAEIFDTVAKKTVDRFLEGYNGTVFAYGQTSTGKTYTVEGSARQYEDRGLIPRTLSYIFERRKTMTQQSWCAENGKEAEAQDDETAKVSRSETQENRDQLNESRGEGERGVEMKVHISYMEIYQDTGYDLLNPGTRPGSLMLTLPKVQISEGSDGSVVVRDLSTHEAATEQVALSLLFQGSTCRKVAETAMNQSSSRSHSIFTITMTTKQPGSAVILRSKLHLVDLAGSERVSKTGSDGHILQEAKHINLSLHHLEHVIVSLQQQTNSKSKSSTAGGQLQGGTTGTPARSSPISRGGRRTGRVRGHIPYRNSMLTMVLRDSLGGNCLTAMIATVSGEEANIWETISTLRFSQRVACISNPASRNEELDDKAVIKKLKRKVIELERELTTLRETGVSPTQVARSASGAGLAVSEAERSLCHRVLYDFFHGKIQSPVDAGINTPALFQECLQVLRSIVIQAVKAGRSDGEPSLTIPANSQRASFETASAQEQRTTNEAETERKEKRSSAARKRTKSRRNHTREGEPVSQSPAGRTHSSSPERDSYFLQTPPQAHGSTQQTPPQAHGSTQQTPPQAHRSTQQTPPQAHRSTQQTPPQAHRSTQQTPPQAHRSTQQTPPQAHRSTRKGRLGETASSPLCWSTTLEGSLSSSAPTPAHPHTHTVITPSLLHTSHTSPTTLSHTPTPTPSRPHTSPSLTPISTSRLSSGIGSLQEEEAVTLFHSTGYGQTTSGARTPLAYGQREAAAMLSSTGQRDTVNGVRGTCSETNAASHRTGSSVSVSPESSSVRDSLPSGSSAVEGSRRKRHTSKRNSKKAGTRSLGDSQGGNTNDVDRRQLAGQEAENGRTEDQPDTWAKRVSHLTHGESPPLFAHPNKSPASHFNPAESPSNAAFSIHTQTPTSLSPHIHNSSSTPAKTPVSTDSRTSAAASLSPQERAVQQQLQQRTDRLQRSQEKREQLTGDVELLSLRVEEEELKTQLCSVAEQLAGQHARILSYQQAAGAGSSVSQATSSSQQMRSEKIAEQQLRIKQARLHQKFLSVQQQIKLLRTPPSNRESKTLSFSPMTANTTGSPTAAVPTTTAQTSRASIPKMMNDVTRTEVKHTKVQKEIEQLRVSQAEKQLELKEAATRRKLQELKQQLLESPTPHPPSPSHPADLQHKTKSHSHSPVSPSSGIPHSNSVIQTYGHSTTSGGVSVSYKPPATAPQPQHQHTSYSDRQRAIMERLAQSVDGRRNEQEYSSSQENSIHGQDLVQLHPQDAQETAVKFRQSTDENEKLNTYTLAMSSIHAQPSSTKQTDTGKLPFTQNAPTHSQNQRDSKQQSIQHSHDTATHHETKWPTTQKEPAFSQPYRHNSRESRKPESEKQMKQQRMPLPEEVKEREYMSAVQQQRLRVSRIRRCIAAATVIQRAWRLHRQIGAQSI